MPPEDPPRVLSATEEAILRAAWEYQYFTARDVQHLLGLRSRPHMRGVLSRLCGGRDNVEGQYLLRCAIPNTRIGGVEKFYCLGSLGREVIARELGGSVEGYYRPSKIAHRSYGTLTHDLALSRFLIALRTWCQTRQDIRLLEIRTQYELARDPRLRKAPKKSTKKDTRSTVVPDAWLHMKLVKTGDPPKRAPILLEIDGGTQWQQAFKRRLSARLSFIRPNGLYSQVFATEFVTIVYLTIAGTVRRDAMALWAAEVLAAEQREDWAEVLLFGEVSFGKMYEEANTLFTAPVFYRPDGGAAVRLFGEPPDTGEQ
jgi:hypothetical protein